MAETTGHLPAGATAAPSARNLTGTLVILLLAFAPQFVELLIALAGLIVPLSGRGPLQVLFAHSGAMALAIPALVQQAAGGSRTALSSDMLLAVIYTAPLLAVALFTRLARIRAPQDYYGGVALMALALFALWASSDLQGMRGFSFGPGTAPRMLGVLLLGLGAVVATVGVIADGPDIMPYHWRGPLFVFLAILTFAVAIRPLGLVIAGLGSFLISALGTSETRWGETLLVGIALTIGCAVLFPYVLGLPMPLVPRFLVP